MVERVPLQSMEMLRAACKQNGGATEENLEMIVG